MVVVLTCFTGDIDAEPRIVEMFTVWGVAIGAAAEVGVLRAGGSAPMYGTGGGSPGRAEGRRWLKGGRSARGEGGDEGGWRWMEMMSGRGF